MGESNQRSGLEMHYDSDHEKKEWILQRFGWGLMLLASVAALSGVLGDGPMSKRQKGKVGDDLYFENDRYVRHQSPFKLKLFCRPRDTEFSISFNRAYLDKNEVKEIQPEPQSTTIDGQNCTFVFNGTSGKVQLVTFHLIPEAFGKIQNEITLDGNHTQKMEQFIWP
ncbi:MAG: hypothetical protein ACXW3L_08645 [Limisphaerales bacterium]